MTEEQKPTSQDPWTNNPQVSETTPAEKNNVEPDKNRDWEREVLSKLAMAAVTEQRRARRWGIFFKSVMALYLVVILFALLSSGDGNLSVGKHTALIDLNGVIASDSEASADNIIPSLRDAFENKNTVGVILRINSPGGSPVQAGYINDEIKRLRKEYPKTPIYAVISDVCASGGYYIAVAADEIYADKASMVGSIGVLMSTFGFVETMNKLGVERRLLTAGESKGFMDPFSPMKDKDVQHVKGMLTNIHAQFIKTVKEGRGDRLKGGDELFTGLVWTGEQGIELGLVDGLGSASYVAREIIGEEKIVDYTRTPDPFEKFTHGLGMSMAATFAKIVGLGPTELR
ncbi:MAG: S49 family peptidase [Gammaproteobacteria bacterium]|nr:S49 family peptidase [Gammaproteobacteria bacterium]